MHMNLQVRPALELLDSALQQQPSAMFDFTTAFTNTCETSSLRSSSNCRHIDRAQVKSDIEKEAHFDTQ